MVSYKDSFWHTRELGNGLLAYHVAFMDCLGNPSKIVGNVLRCTFLQAGRQDYGTHPDRVGCRLFVQICKVSLLGGVPRRTEKWCAACFPKNPYPIYLMPWITLTTVNTKMNDFPYHIYALKKLDTLSKALARKSMSYSKPALYLVPYISDQCFKECLYATQFKTSTKTVLNWRPEWPKSIPYIWPKTWASRASVHLRE